MTSAAQAPQTLNTSHTPPIEFPEPESGSYVEMHPALDIVGDTLYVTLLAPATGARLQHVVLSSDGNLFLLDTDGWKNECEIRGLLPRAEVNLRRCGPRWTQNALRAFQNKKGRLKEPDWEQTFLAIREALDDRLVVAEPTYLDVLALYAMMTYFHPLFDYLPILHLRGPAESGKSRAGDALAYLAFNGIKEGSATRAVIFRHAHQGRFTQVLAEGDHLSTRDSGDDFVRDLQSSCSKGEATVEVAEGKNSTAKGAKGGYEPVTYYTFSPRVILSTKGFKSQPLRSRCIELDFVKSAHPDSRKLSHSMNDDRVWSPLRNQLYKHQLMQWQQVRATLEWLAEDWRGPHDPTGRMRDNWLPLAVMAALVSGELLETVKTLALEDAPRHQQDTANTFDAALMKFAYWLVQGGQKQMGRNAMYNDFIGKDELRDTYEDDFKSPRWARETETTVTRDQLQQWVKGPQVLLTELQRLTLVPRQHVHRDDGNVYRLDAEHIRGIAQAYMGDLATDATGG